MQFPGFPAKALALLPALPGKSADEYNAHKDLLNSGVRTPGAALIAEVADALPVNLTTSPRSSVSPLHRDLRFAKPGAPRYKDHLLLTAWEGPEKSSAAILWLRIDGTHVGYASGIAFSPGVRDRWRNAVAGAAGQELEAHLAALAKAHKRRHYEIDAERNKRTPKPWDDSHPRAELLRYKSFQARFIEPHPKSISTPAFAAHCAKRLETLLPVHRWLTEHLTAND